MGMIYDYSTTILALDGNAEISIFGEDEWANVTWKDGNPKNITEKQVIDKQAAFQAEYDAQEYARERALAFPSIGDQLDMQFHDLVDGTTTWKDAVAKVKSDNPKE